MQKTKIEWCDSTWSPVTGCLHGCEYCYAREMTRRFGTRKNAYWDRDQGHICHCNGVDMPILESPVMFMSESEDGGCSGFPVAVNPYPAGFTPTFHKYLLDRPQGWKKPRNIFVVSMGDLFGDWVPAEWVNEILWNACGKGEQHKYLFLTKNPKRYHEFIRSRLDYRINHWYGTTVTDSAGFSLNGRAHELHKLKDETRSNIFLSIEPLHERITGTPLGNLKFFDWVIIGAESGNRPGKIIPQKEWVLEIAEQCKSWNVPVFMKDSLIPIVGEENMLREFPAGLRRDSDAIQD